MSPKISFKQNIIFNQQDLIKQRNKLDLYEKYKSGDLLIWLKNNLNVTIDHKSGALKDIQGYYGVLNLLYSSLTLENEKEQFNIHFNEVKSLKDKHSELLKDRLGNLIREYELFLKDIGLDELENFFNASISIFTGTAAIFDSKSDEISDSFSSNIKDILSKGYQGDNFKNHKVIRIDTDSQKYIDIPQEFFLKNCQGPLTINSFDPCFSNYNGQNKSVDFLDVDSKNMNAVINRLYHPTSIELKHPMAFIEYIEVDNYEL